MNRDQAKEKLLQLHKKENEMNKLIAGFDNKIKGLEREKKRVAKMVSSNMKYRNQIIKQWL